ncbi:LysR family transcriptional regulator [Thioclava sp. FR2]|uniref:LysR family transcriptional regulator n=1 Tax=Thioclava sp. FR2 TaxID=3445780 RepID=UPI003EBD1DA4
MPVAPPRPKDLPLSALRAFEAAARLGGFSAAGVELGVTPGAVTAHIKGLEEILGAKLFQRGARGVALTPLAKRMLPEISAAFDALASASKRLRDEAAPKTVHIATLPAIAQLWLSPRLPEIRALAPDISISITAMEAPPNLKRAPFDLCLFYLDEVTQPFGRDEIFPVCTAEVAERLNDVESLEKVNCLSDASWINDWSAWLSMAAPGKGIVPRGPVFSLYALAVEEAINGAGVLMGRRAMVEKYLQSGRLVAPFADRLTLESGLCLWSDRHNSITSAARWVERWLQSKAA